MESNRERGHGSSCIRRRKRIFLEEISITKHNEFLHMNDICGKDEMNMKPNLMGQSSFWTSSGTHVHKDKQWALSQSTQSSSHNHTLLIKHHFNITRKFKPTYHRLLLSLKLSYQNYISGFNYVCYMSYPSLTCLFNLLTNTR
jgi:hypothetical protein